MIENAQKLLNEAQAVLIIAGAGMSADSGLPTYRGKDGFWNHYPYYRQFGKGYEEVSRPYTFTQDPKGAWGFYGHLSNLYNEVNPHNGYSELLNYLMQNDKKYFILSSNVDGHFLKAGYNHNLVHEVHGTIHKHQCSKPCTREAWIAPSCNYRIDMKTMKLCSEIPKCLKCLSTARPNIFMFGDNDKSYIWEEAQKGAERFREWFEQNATLNMLLLVIGVGTEGLKIHAKEYVKQSLNGHIIVINPIYDDYFCLEKNVSILKDNAYSIIKKLCQHE